MQENEVQTPGAAQSPQYLDGTLLSKMAHGGAAVLFSDYARVIHNGVSDAVNGGRERIVDEADMQVFHDMLLSDGFSGASRRENARQPFSALRILR